MRSGRFGLLFFLLLFRISVQAQPSQQVTAPPAAPQDPQAVSVLSQALTVAGGTSTISAIQDYTATGTVTYHWAQDVQGALIIRGRGVSDIRVDAHLLSGMRSSTMSGGQIARKAEDGTVWRMPATDKIVNSDAFPYQAPMFPSGLAIPHLQLAAVLKNPRLNLFYKGVVSLDGHSAYDVQAQRMNPGGTKAATPFLAPNNNFEAAGGSNLEWFSAHNSVDFFIDVSNYNVLMVQDVIPMYIVHQIRYADFRLINGVSIPFSISEQASGQKTWVMQLDRIEFNQGLQDSVFALQ